MNKAKGSSPDSASSTRKLALPPLALDWHRWLPLAGGTMLLVIAAFFAWQTSQILRDSAAKDQLVRERDRMSVSLAEFIAEMRAAVTTALATPGLAETAAIPDPTARQNAIAMLRQALPESTNAELYSTEMGEVLSSDFRRFGYSKAAQLMKARSSPAPVQTISIGKAGRVLSFAEPVVVGGQTVAIAWIEMPLQPLLDRFEQANLGPGRLELHQGDGNNDLVLDGVGTSGPQDVVPDRGIVIEGTAFRVATRPPDVFIVGPRNPLLYAVLAIIFAVSGWLSLWLRKVGVRVGIRRLSSRLGAKEVVESNMTMAEALQKAPAAARPVVRPGAPPRPRMPPPGPPSAPVSVDRSIFRAYDIRGVLGKTLNADVARMIGRAIGSEGVERGLREIVVGRDGRLSGPEMSAALIDGLRQGGMDVIDIGMVPTPVVYFATFQLNTGSGVAVTGSHNPPDYNGFKIVLGGETLAESAIQNLYARISENRLTQGSGGLQTMDSTADYIERIVSDIQVEQRLKIVVDCGNGVPGAVAPAVLEGIGCEVMPLYCDVDGTFPNHHPDPSEPKNLRDLILTVKQLNADLGLAFDGDGDRLGVVTKSGEIIYPDRLLMLFAKDVLSRNPGASIIYDVKCTGKLQPEILKHGGSPIMWKTGHSLIKSKMRETDAELAGEMSGHFFFRERWYGFDDGIYAAARLMEILSSDLDGRDPQQIFDSLPKGVSTPELKIEMAEGEHYRFVERFKERASFEGARVTTIDGVRADWPDGWGLVRASNTTPVLVLRFDADNDRALLRIQQAYRTQLLALDSRLALPF